LRVGIIVGLSIAAFAFAWIFVIIGSGIIVYDAAGSAFTATWFVEISKIAGLVGLTLFCAVLIAKLVGGALPMLAVALKKDPAVMSSPFVTTIVDVSALLIYFLLSSAIFGLF
jgi:magnesium transporter